MRGVQYLFLTNAQGTSQSASMWEPKLRKADAQNSQVVLQLPRWQPDRYLWSLITTGTTSVWQLVTFNAFTLDKLIDKRMNSERKLTLLMGRAIERICWEAPANSDTTTREPCRAERSGRSGAFTERASRVKRRNTKRWRVTHKCYTRLRQCSCGWSCVCPGDWSRCHGFRLRWRKRRQSWRSYVNWTVPARPN